MNNISSDLDIIVIYILYKLCVISVLFYRINTTESILCWCLFLRKKILNSAKWDIYSQIRPSFVLPYLFYPRRYV